MRAGRSAYYAEQPGRFRGSAPGRGRGVPIAAGDESYSPRLKCGMTAGIGSDSSTNPRYSPRSYHGDW